MSDLVGNPQDRFSGNVVFGTNGLGNNTFNLENMKQLKYICTFFKMCTFKDVYQIKQ